MKRKGFKVCLSHRTSAGEEEMQLIRQALVDLAEEGPAIMDRFRSPINWIATVRLSGAHSASYVGKQVRNILETLHDKSVCSGFTVHPLPALHNLSVVVPHL